MPAFIYFQLITSHKMGLSSKILKGGAALLIVGIIVVLFVVVLPIYFLEQQESRQKAKDELGICYCKDPMEDMFVKLYHDANLEDIHNAVRQNRLTDSQVKQFEKRAAKMDAVKAENASLQSSLQDLVSAVDPSAGSSE